MLWTSIVDLILLDFSKDFDTILLHTINLYIIVSGTLYLIPFSLAYYVVEPKE